MIFEVTPKLTIHDAVVISGYRYGKYNPMPIDKVELIELEKVYSYSSFCIVSDFFDKLLRKK